MQRLFKTDRYSMLKGNVYTHNFEIDCGTDNCGYYLCTTLISGFGCSNIASYITKYHADHSCLHVLQLLNDSHVHACKQAYKSSVEDELHFLFDCGHYHDLEEHKVMLSYCEYINNSFKDLSNIDKWSFISNINDLYARYLLCRFVVKGLQTRTVLLNNLIKLYKIDQWTSWLLTVSKIIIIKGRDIGGQRGLII